MEIMLSIIYIFVEIVKVSVVMGLILNYSLSRQAWKYFICAPVLVIIVVLASITGYNALITHSISLMVITFLVMMFLISEKLHRIILTFIPVYLCIGCIDILCAKVFAMFFTQSVIRLDDIFWRFIYNFIGTLIICIFSVLINWARGGNRRNILTKEWCAIIAGVILCDVMAISYSVLRMSGTSKQQDVFGLIFLGACITVIIAICAIILLFDSREKYKMVAAYNEKLLQTQQEYYQRALMQDERLKMFQHDIKNHIRYLRVFTEKQDMQQLKEYLGRMDDTVSSTFYKCDVGNDLVNCILSDTEKEYENAGITLRVEGHFPSEVHINNMDIGIIVSNAISNAFEAAAKVKSESNRLVYFRIRSIHHILFIEITNPVDAKVPVHNGMLVTTKENKDLHGFGIRNIRECLKKYNGLLEYDCTKNEMKTKIVLMNLP